MAESDRARLLFRFVPALDSLRQYSWAAFRGDVAVLRLLLDGTEPFLPDGQVADH
mgnify:CR=1 FL=1